MNNYHKPVLLQEVLTLLAVRRNGQYIDCTLGGGGHTKALLDLGAQVLGIDTDNDAINYVNQELGDRIEIPEHSLIVAKGNFVELTAIARENGFESVDGILLDLGVSSHQLDDPERGFSFKDGPLDMRMDSSLTVKASDLINGLTEKELTELFLRFGEEPFAKKIAKVIVEKRRGGQIKRTSELAELIKVNMHSKQGIHPATRVFQALRIAVNDELDILRRTIPQAIELLKPQGRLVVISFHSLEDRIVKDLLNQYEKEHQVRILTSKPVVAAKGEVLQNNRARSAKLRALEKV